VRFVLVGEQVRRSFDELADHLALAERQLLAGVRDKGVAALTALLGVPDHALGIVRPDQHERGISDPLRDGTELDQPGLAHRSGVETGELGHRGVGGAHEAGGVQLLGDPHRVTVHAVALEPGPVVGEVLPGGTHQHWAEAEAAETEGDVPRAAAATDLEIVDEERHRELVQLLDDQ
jgi:hypothetical protein